MKEIILQWFHFNLAALRLFYFLLYIINLFVKRCRLPQDILAYFRILAFIFAYVKLNLINRVSEMYK